MEVNICDFYGKFNDMWNRNWNVYSVNGFYYKWNEYDKVIKWFIITILIKFEFKYTSEGPTTFFIKTCHIALYKWHSNISQVITFNGFHCLWRTNILMAFTNYHFPLTNLSPKFQHTLNTLILTLDKPLGGWS